MKTAGKNISFKKTIEKTNLWVDAFIYNFIVFLLNDWLSKPAGQVVTKSQTTTAIEKVNSIVLPQGGRPLPSPFLAALVQIFIFDLVFTVIFYLNYRSKKKLFNIYAIFTAVFITTLLFLAFTRLVFVNYSRM